MRERESSQKANLCGRVIRRPKQNSKQGHISDRLKKFHINQWWKQQTDMNSTQKKNPVKENK